MTTQLDAISQAIGALQAQGQERSQQMDRLDKKIDTLIGEVRDGYHRRANLIQGGLGKIELRVGKLETARAEFIGERRANLTWASIVAAGVGSAVSILIENWHAVFGGKP